MSYQPVYEAPASTSVADSRYVLDDPDLVLAVNVALATERPLLLRGPPGSGKSTLARHVALCLGAPFYPKVVTSRTRARDLQWDFDAVARLGEAQVAAALGRDLPAKERYVEPGVLWWAFAPDSAPARGAASLEEDLRARDPGIRGPAPEARPSRPVGAVVLVDEIDKADPDVPNDLLMAIDQQWFVVAETGFRVHRKDATAPPFVVFTTNEERELAPAFLRRCVVYEIGQRSVDELVRVAEAHHGDGHAELYARLATRVVALRREHEKRGEQRPGTAEFLDAVKAALRLEPDDAALADIERVVLERPRKAT